MRPAAWGALLAVLLVALPALPAFAQWEYRYEVDSTDDDIYVIVADEVHQRVYAGTDYGIAYLDIPSDQWTLVEPPGQADPVTAVAWDPVHSQRLLLGHWSGKIELSNDLGATRTEVYAGTPSWSIAGIERDPGNANLFYACTRDWNGESPGRILRSGNGGLSWELLYQDEAHEFLCLAVDAGGAVYVGSEDGILRSRDGGESWGPAGLAGTPINSLAAVPAGVPGRAYAGTNYEVWATRDGGDSWQPIGLGEKCLHVALDPLHPATLVAHLSWGVGPPDYVLLSYDDGANWQYTGYDWIAMDWSSLRTLDVSASDHMIYANNFHEIWSCPLEVTAAPAPAPNAPSLSLWPNPFNPRTRIAFDLDEAGPVSLSVYDTRGACVRRLIDGRRLQAGHHETDWGGRDDRDQALASGVFLIRIDVGAQSATRKAILLN